MNAYKQIMTKGYMKKVNTLFKTAYKNPHIQNNQVDMRLSLTMINNKPLTDKEKEELNK